MSTSSVIHAPSDCLKHCELFSGFEPEALAHIAAQFELARYGKGQTIFSEGDPSDGMYVIGEGEVAVVKEIGLGDRELVRLGAGAHFGEIALVTKAPRNATLKAVTAVVCARMTEDGFHALMADDPRFAQRILQELSDRFGEIGAMATREVTKAHQALIFSLAKLADSRDPETGAHLYRVRDYCTLLAELLSEAPKFRGVVDEAFIETIYLTSPLHDIGKVAIPDGILLKQGKLTDAEFQIMATHTTIGAEAIDRVLEYCDFEAFHMARRIVLYHHERYDGAGYPHGVKGEDIPIEARIMTLADIYDALLSKRVYKPPYSYKEARERIAQSSGAHFDPVMTQVMIDNMDAFETVHKKYESGTPGW